MSSNRFAKLRPLPPGDVRLLDGTMRDRQAICARYLLALDADRLLHNFRVNAALPSSAAPLGGWEAPQCGLRGHFTGHFLSACAAMYAGTGDVRFRQRAEQIVDGLGRCQTALGGGYLSAFPIDQFDTLERTPAAGAWAPYYTLHKILAGLLCAFRDAGIERALPIARQLGLWIVARMNRLPGEVLEPLLRTDAINPSNEYGGIGESLYQLHEITGDARFFETAKLFDRPWFLSPLMHRRDCLAGLHANTTIPQALAAARRCLLTGDQPYRDAAEYFFSRTAEARSYVNGGSSGPRPDRQERSEGGEHWPEPFKLAGTLTPKINESCVANNMLRLADALFSITGDAKYAEFHERVLFNSVLAMQHPSQPGGYLYSHPLAPGSRKVFGDFDQTFWCCYGTTVEAYARLADGAYFVDEHGIWVTQFLASEATWREREVRVVQQSRFPYSETTTLTIQAPRETEFSLRVRIPSWTAGATWTLRGSGDDGGIARSGILELNRRWRDGDVVELHVPMSVRAEMLLGDDCHLAFCFGPIVLAARTHHALELGVPAPLAVGAIERIDAESLRFSARLGFGGDVQLVPLCEIVDESFGVYFRARS